MNRLYIIGNGFDRYHNLPTGYNDFHQFVIKNHPSLENTFERYFELSTKLNTDNKKLWADFENDLSTFNWKAFFDEKNQIDVLDDSFRPSFIYGLEDDLEQETDILISSIREAFEDWLTDLSLESTTRKLYIEEDSLFITFNYTLTLEEVYQITREKVLHIHGDVENDQGFLVFGHNKNLKAKPKFDKYGETTRTPFSDSEAIAQQPFYKLQKPVKDVISENENFFKNLKDINEVKILGHSLNTIDLPYFKKIKKYVLGSPKWKVSFYSDAEKIRHLHSLQKIGIDEHRIEFFKMSDYDLL
ncbi:bacteriophage abortive infection AbiH family protein [Chryseobacterium sp. Y16C]|uniref:bacteriophage abortive infection AbiH family protein n=1 Tax=Chryseobacterium sp. Y16C TaxID=2920939 RepID=UPI001F0AC1A6|nr:bacteriophage abortive infection AbiH family protein [Chryseobacterium sp. Y16C]UMQ41574.1 bacteriophage abortive infection AbiH family protein [Chryseobacterium sp. Y16C]